MLKLPRLPENWLTQPFLVRRYWDDAMKSLEKTLNAILEIPAIQSALTGVQDDLTSAKQEASLVNSYPSGFTAPLISASSAGMITIANHSRVYGDPVLNPTVSVTGATFSSGATTGQVVRVYYSDPSRAGGAVTYLFTVDPATPMAQGNDKHSVGAVTIPVAGTGGGGGVTPPGFVDSR